MTVVDETGCLICKRYAPNGAIKCPNCGDRGFLVAIIKRFGSVEFGYVEAIIPADRIDLSDKK